MLWNCHRGIYRNDFYVNHQTYLSEPVINFGGLEVELGYPSSGQIPQDLSFILLRFFIPWIFHQFAEQNPRLVGPPPPIFAVLPRLPGPPGIIGGVFQSGHSQQVFFWKLTTSCQRFFPKRCQYHCIILLWLLYDTSMILLGVVALWIRWMTRTIHRFHTNFWCDRRDQHRILSSVFNTELPWKNWVPVLACFRIWPTLVASKRTSPTLPALQVSVLGLFHRLWP